MFRIAARAPVVALLVVVLASFAVAPAFAAPPAFLDSFATVSTVGSTVPSNGDVNPYGVAIVPRTTGRLVAGDILVSNFNAKSNKQGTGTTIVELTPGGTRTLFSHITDRTVNGQCPGGVGLTTALVVLRAGWVIVGSLPTSNGTPATARAGCLVVLDANGRFVETLRGGGIDGPWDMTALDGGAFAELFVTNVLNGTVAAHGAVVHRGTVLRLLIQAVGVRRPKLLLTTVVGSGFAEKTDPDALVVGPTGLGLGMDGTLYVADTVNSRITAIHAATYRVTSAGNGTAVSTGGSLKQPLGLALAPNGDVLTVNAGDGNIVETTPQGTQVATKTIDSTGGGGGLLFGLAVRDDGSGVYLVDDGTNTLDLFH